MKNNSAILRINLDLSDKNIEQTLRFKEALESISKYSSIYSKLVIISHRGRPVGYDKKLSLYPIALKLNQYLQNKVSFISSLNKEDITDKTKDNGIYLLENIRFFKEEELNDTSFSKFLASLGSIYINDDFATSHRKHASNYGIVKYVKGISGMHLLKEVKTLSKSFNNPRHPFLLIIGGGKIEDKIDVINSLGQLADNILLGGGPGNTALLHSGYQIYDSIGKDGLKIFKKIKYKNKIIFPIDVRVSKNNILDIGPHTEEIFLSHINKAKTILWSGPLGAFEKKQFARGSTSIAEGIANAKALSIIGGGETVSLVVSLGLENKMSFISSGGSAMLHFLSKKKMPALEALGIKY